MEYMRRSASASRRSTSKLSSGQNAVPTLRATRLRPDNFSARFAGCFRAQPRSDYHEFISAHAGNIIVASAGLLQVAGKILQQVIAFEVAMEIVDLLEVVEVANHH